MLTKIPGATFGAVITFNHRGPAANPWVGIGIAYAQISGHNAPRAYAMAQVAVKADLDWYQYTVTVQGTVPLDTTTGSQDAQRFISDTQPVVGSQPPNPYGVNNWDDDVYAVVGANELSGLTVTYT